jgi:hypothetical protein
MALGQTGLHFLFLKFLITIIAAITAIIMMKLLPVDILTKVKTSNEGMFFSFPKMAVDYRLILLIASDRHS